MFLRAREEKIIGVTSEQKVNTDKKDKEENLEQKTEKKSLYKDEGQRKAERETAFREAIKKVKNVIREVENEGRKDEIIARDDRLGQNSLQGTIDVNRGISEAKSSAQEVLGSTSKKIIVKLQGQEFLKTATKEDVIKVLKDNLEIIKAVQNGTESSIDGFNEETYGKILEAYGLTEIVCKATSKYVLTSKRREDYRRYFRTKGKHR